MDLLQIFNILSEYFLSFGYIGIFILMTLESTFIPFPSVLVMVPAGYFVSTGRMSLTLVIAAAVLGSITGALFNYFLGLKIGRVVILKYGRCFGVTEEKLNIADGYFKKYGTWSTFIGRLIPLIRQFISLPAGITRMNPFIFCLYTGLGAGVWVIFLTIVGIVCGQNEELIHYYLSYFKNYIFFFVTFLVSLLFVYKFYRINRNRVAIKNNIKAVK